MSRYQAKVKLLLKSDTIFGSGQSTPGAEDVAVKKDDHGRPYLSGSTVKGLFRDAAENYLSWTMEDIAKRNQLLTELLGSAESWTSGLHQRSVCFSPMTLCPGQEEANLYLQRTNTQIDPQTGTVKSSSLRVLSCIRVGTTFEGTVVCAQEDTDIVRSVFSCIKALGTSRNRGMGQVAFQLEKWEELLPNKTQPKEVHQRVLTYHLHLLEPLRVTNRAISHNTFLGACRVIPGSTIRGHVMGYLSRVYGDWFKANKVQLLRNVRFSDIVPLGDSKPVIPTPMGFYANKTGSVFYSLLKEGDVRPGTKRASLAAFCSLEKDTNKPGLLLRAHRFHTGMETRLNIRQAHDASTSGGVFQTEHLLPGQQGQGMVIFGRNVSMEVRQKVTEAISAPEMRLGANTSAGFGRCCADELKWREDTPESVVYGFNNEEPISTTLYMLLLSPLCMSNSLGDPCALDHVLMSRLLGTEVTALLCATSTRELSGYNNTLGTRLPIRTCYERGCVFKVTTSQPVLLSILQAIEQEGLGLYREEGMGRVLFIRQFEEILGKEKKSPEHHGLTATEQKFAWLNRQVEPFRKKFFKSNMSPSQLGDFESEFCAHDNQNPEEARRSLTMWYDGFRRYDEEKGIDDAETKQKAEWLKDYVEKDILDSEETPASTVKERIQLLKELIQLSRKEAL